MGLLTRCLHNPFCVRRMVYRATYYRPGRASDVSGAEANGQCLPQGLPVLFRLIAVVTISRCTRSHRHCT